MDNPEKKLATIGYTRRRKTNQQHNTIWQTNINHVNKTLTLLQTNINDVNKTLTLLQTNTYPLWRMIMMNFIRSTEEFDGLIVNIYTCIASIDHMSIQRDKSEYK